MSNKITFGNYTFTDSDIISAKIYQEESPISETLSADTLTVTVHSDKVGEKKLYTTFMEWFHTSADQGYVLNDDNLQDYKYADPIYYYKNNVLYGKFFVTQVDRIGTDQFKISATSGIGLLVRQQFPGDVYSSTTARTLINSIMSGTSIPYEIENAVGNTVINGYLPYSYKRDCLQQVLFAIGANVLKDSATGKLRFVFNLPSSSKSVPDSRMYIGGTNQITSPVTKINLTEHTYYRNPSSESELVYAHTGSSASHSLIILDEPIIASTITYDSGITIHKSGANYIEFSGLGNIYAIKYTHVSTEVTWESDDTNAEEHACNVSQATLVTALNSANVMKRLIKYYTQAKETDCSIVLNDEKPGDYISYTDPFGDEATGFIKSLDIGVSNLNKADAKVVTNWYPTEGGNNFNAYRLIQSTGTVTVPSSAVGKPGRIVLIGGFRGGQGGTAGESGTDATTLHPSRGEAYCGGKGGTHGGKGGKGGTGVMVKSFDIPSLPSTFSVTAIGTGGAGGSAGAYNGTGSLGSLGGNTTVTVGSTSYSSASGSEDTTGFINFIDGTFYNLAGKDGYDNETGVGGDGTQGHTYESGKYSYWATDVNVQPGGSVTYEGVTWAGGAVGKYGGKGYGHTYGGGGGGGAYGAKGYDGHDGGSGGSYPGGTGGAGATPITPAKAQFPYCGSGGHGGGCGGGAGASFNTQGEGLGVSPGTGGAGGSGSPGGQGSDGAVIFYYGS